jgi:hypothetical protein
MFIRFVTYFVFISLSLFSSLTNASSPISNVGNSPVTEGRLTFDTRFGYISDDESAMQDRQFLMRQHIDYGFTGWYAGRIVVIQNRRDGENLEHQAINLDNRFQLFEKDIDGFDAGLRLIYSHRDGDDRPSEVNFRFISNVPFAGNWLWSYDTVLEHEVGPNARSGLALELRHQLAYDHTPQTPAITKVRAGLQAFNSFGRLKDLSGYHNQNHQIGPFARFSFKNGTYLQTGYRKGLSRSAPDHVVNLYTGVNF